MEPIVKTKPAQMPRACLGMRAMIVAPILMSVFKLPAKIVPRVKI